MLIIKKTGYGTGEGLQLKQREASFPHYNLIVRKESDGIVVKIEAILMVHLISLGVCALIGQQQYAPPFVQIISK